MTIDIEPFTYYYSWMKGDRYDMHVSFFGSHVATLTFYAEPLDWDDVLSAFIKNLFSGAVDLTEKEYNDNG